MYESPIREVYSTVQKQIEENIYKAVVACDVHVEKEELIKALAYDRDQYVKGHTDALASIVHCEDCQHLHKINDVKIYAICPRTSLIFPQFGEIDTRKHFCGFGERRGAGDE